MNIALYNNNNNNTVKNSLCNWQLQLDLYQNRTWTKTFFRVKINQSVFIFLALKWEKLHLFFVYRSICTLSIAFVSQKCSKNSGWKMWLIKMNNYLDEKCSVSLIYVLLSILSTNLTLLLKTLSHLPFTAYSMSIFALLCGKIYVYGITVTNYIAPEFV